MQHMLLSADVGNDCMKTFVEKRLVKQEISVFDKIKNKLNTGIKELHKKPRLVEAFKDGFEILAAEDVPLNEGFRYPVTKLPMSIAESKTDLRGASNASKSRFPNSTLNKANTDVYVCPKSAVWTYDVGKFVRSIVPESTWQTFFDKLSKKMMSPKDAKAVTVHLMTDSHRR